MKITPIFLRYDYGEKSRGDSGEYRFMYPALKSLEAEIYPFWFDGCLKDKEKLQKEVISHIDNIKPDYVFFILMNDEFSFKTLDYLKSKYTTINWFCDDEWRFDEYTRIYAPHFTQSISMDKYSLGKYRSIGYKNVILSHWASYSYEPDINFSEIDYRYDVSFVGQISGYRKWIIKELSKKDINVACFGHGWPKGKVSFEEMRDIFRTSRINLNISNSVSSDYRYILSSPRSLKEFIKSQKRKEQIKARNFEIPAFGGFQMTNYVPPLEDFFCIGKEIAVYTSPEDLALQAHYFLENEGERRKMMIEGHKKAGALGTYNDRMKDIFKAIRGDL